MIAEIVDEIYEAAVIPEKWPTALSRIAAVAASKGGALGMFAHGLPVGGRAIPWLQDLLEECLSDERIRLSAPASCMGSIQPASFIDVDSLMTAQEIHNDPMRIRLRARGLGANARAVISLPGGEIAHFVFLRGLEDGSYKPAHLALLNRLWPDMARASLAVRWRPWR